jgi:GNAT superfamily N-acetyltransferase
MRKNESGRVRKAIDSDIPVIEAWLPRDPGIESLAVNWKITLEVYKEKGMWVWADNSTHEPVAYFWGSLNSTSSILEVRPDRRGEGIGYAFVDHLIEVSRSHGEGLLAIECAPESSAAFWNRMGFTIILTGRKVLGYRILPIPRPIPEGVPLRIQVAFFPEEAAYDRSPTIKPFVEYSLEGTPDSTGLIQLNQKVAYYEPPEGDLVVQLFVDDERIYRGKAKYEEAEMLGFERCHNGFAVSSLNLKKHGPKQRSTLAHRKKAT